MARRQTGCRSGLASLQHGLPELFYRSQMRGRTSRIPLRSLKPMLNLNRVPFPASCSFAKTPMFAISFTICARFPSQKNFLAPEVQVSHLQAATDLHDHRDALGFLLGRGLLPPGLQDVDVLARSCRLMGEMLAEHRSGMARRCTPADSCKKSFAGRT